MSKGGVFDLIRCGLVLFQCLFTAQSHSIRNKTTKQKNTNQTETEAESRREISLRNTNMFFQFLYRYTKKRRAPFYVLVLHITAKLIQQKETSHTFKKYALWIQNKSNENKISIFSAFRMRKEATLTYFKLQVDTDTLLYIDFK